MKTTYWLLFAAMIVQWLFVLLTELFSQLWLGVALAVIVLILSAVGLLRLTARNNRFWISIGCLVAATVLLALSEHDHGDPSLVALFGIAAFFAYRITLCFFIRDSAPEISRRRAANTAIAYGLCCVFILCGMVYHFEWYTRIGVMILIVCEFLMLRLFWFCAREKGAESRRDKWYALALVLFVLLGTGFVYFLGHHPLGSFISETGKPPTSIVWEKRIRCSDFGWQMYVYESDGVYIPFSAEEFSDNKWNGQVAYPTHEAADGTNSGCWVAVGWHTAYRTGWDRHDGYLITVNDLPWPLEEDHACFTIPGDAAATVEGWKLEHGWTVLLHRTNDTGPEGMNNLRDIYHYMLHHFYTQAGLTPPLLFSDYTWADIFTEVDGETVFAGLPRDMTPEDMPKFYGMRYEDYVEDQSAYLASQRNGHQFYYNDLTFRLDGAEVRCYVAFKDDALWRITISVSAQDNGWSAEESEAYQTRMQDALNAYFGESSDNRIHWQTEDIRIDTPFASISENLEIVVHYH